MSAEGCSLSDYHVTVQSSNQLRGFVAAIKDPGDEDSMGSDPWDIIVRFALNSNLPESLDF